MTIELTYEDLVALAMRGQVVKTDGATVKLGPGVSPEVKAGKDRSKGLVQFKLDATDPRAK